MAKKKDDIPDWVTDEIQNAKFENCVLTNCRLRNCNLSKLDFR